jgi:hypothetical protein
VVIAAAIAVTVSVTHPVRRYFIRSPIPVGVWGWTLLPPGAKGWVDITVERITYFHQTAELQEIGDRLFSEFSPVASTLPDNFIPWGKTLPIDRLPLKFRSLGGDYAGDNPEHIDLLLRVNANGDPESIVITWGHTRQVIEIFPKPPSPPPTGFYARPLNDRIYVIANEF